MIVEEGNLVDWQSLSGILHFVDHVDLTISLAVGLEYASERVVC